MSRSEGPSGPIPPHLHPFVMPTLFVVGGWLLLIGGYLPGQGGREGATRSVSPGPAAGYAYPEPDTGPAPHPYPEPIRVDRGSGSGPIRLTIELPNGSGAPTSVVVGEADRLPAREPVVAADPAASRASARFEGPVIPPRIPGPPPEFDPSILSPLMPESVPAIASESPILGGTPRTDRLIARPLDELPESFDPGSLLTRYRDAGVESPTLPDAGPAPSGDALPVPDARDNRAPAPPTAPVILPDPLPDLDDADAPEEGPPPIPIRPDAEPRVFQPLPIEPGADRTKASRKGLRGLFRAFRPPPPIPELPPPPPPSPRFEAIPDRVDQRSEPTDAAPAAPFAPSDVLAQTDSLFRSAQTSMPTPVPVPLPMPKPATTGGPPPTLDPSPPRRPISELPDPALSFDPAPEVVPWTYSASAPPARTSAIPGGSRRDPTLVRELLLPASGVDPEIERAAVLRWVQDASIDLE